VLQTGVVSEQSAFDTQPTHAPFDVLHAGVAPEHLLELAAEQTPHEPLGWQAGVAARQSPSVAQA
jgi:hypothetical protein